MKLSAAAATLLALIGALSTVSSLHSAEDSTVVRKVFGKASAPANSALPPGTTFTTGAKSKSELTVPKGLVRVGQKAEVDTTPHGLVLRKGVSLVASEPGRFRKTIEVRAPGYHFKVRGTVQISFDPGHSLKIVVLEGTVTVSLDSLMGEFEGLKPGQMLVINPSDSRLPEPVEIDLQRFVATSGLIGGQFGGLATASNIRAVSGVQTVDFLRNELIETPLLLRGADTAVQLLQTNAASAQTQTAAAAATAHAQQVEQSVFQVVNDLTNPNATVQVLDYMNSSPLTAFGSQNITRGSTDPSTSLLRINLTSQFTEIPPGSGNFVQTAAPSLSGTITVDPQVFTNQTGTLEFFVKDQVSDGPLLMQVNPGTNVSTPPNVGLSLVTLGVDVNSATLQAGNASSVAEPLLISATARDISVTGSTLSGGTVAVTGSTLGGGTQNITVDSTKISGKQGVNIGQATVRTGITIQNSSQLAALASAISVYSKGAPITITNSTLQAANSILIDGLDANDATASGVVTIRNAQLAAEAIRIRGFSPSGDALIIDNSTLNASQMIKLYAEGASTLRFKNTVTLNTAMAILAGKTVQVDSGGSVNISGKGQIYTDTSNYNKAGFGNINAGGGLTTGSYGSRPSF